MIAYAGWLKQYVKEFDVQVRAWVLMTNHVHLLVTPQSDQGVSQMMQALGRIYVRYFNREYRRRELCGRAPGWPRINLP